IVNADSALAEEADREDAVSDTVQNQPADAASAATAEARPVPAPPARASALAPWHSLWKSAAVALWFAGALLFWLIAALRVGRLRQLLRGAQAAPADLPVRVRQLAER